MLIILFAGALAAANSAPTDAMAYFQGSWACQGRLEPSQKPISSTMIFNLDPNTQTIMKSHADRPPGTYHATEIWSWAEGRSQFRATIADAYSGARWFTSPGWKGDVWTWTKFVINGEPLEEFVYTRQAADTLKVDWRVSRKGGPLEIGDTLTCKKA